MTEQGGASLPPSLVLAREIKAKVAAYNDGTFRKRGALDFISGLIHGYGLVVGVDSEHAMNAAFTEARDES